MINFSSLDEAYPNSNKIEKKKKKTDNDSCKPLQVPPYITPMACDVNKDKIIEASMENGLKSFDYDEMDAYLKVNDNNNKEEFSNTTSLVDFLKGFKNIENFSNYDNGSIKIDVNLYNLFLFIFLGIMIILLIDQITRLVAINKK